jgi:hypothetical protein
MTCFAIQSIAANVLRILGEIKLLRKKLNSSIPKIQQPFNNDLYPQEIVKKVLKNYC